MIIDVHAHFAPPQYIADLAGTSMILPPIAGWSVSKHLEEMSVAGVGRSMLSITTPGISFGGVANARRVARYCNEYAASLVREHPGEFGMFAALPLTDAEGSLLELEYALDSLDAGGIGLFTSYEDRWLGDDAFSPVLEELNRRRAIVYVHPIAPHCCEGVLPFLPDPLIEYGTDTTRAISSVIYRGAAARFPGIRWIFSHAGGTMPYLIGRFDTFDRIGPQPVRSLAPEGYRAYARRFYYDTAQSANVATLSALRAVIPPGHVVFGTDYPFGTMCDQVASLSAAGVFGAGEIAAIHSGTIASAMPELVGKVGLEPT